MALKRKGPLSVLWSRPVLIFVPVLGLLLYGVQQADQETSRFQDCVAAGVTPQRAYLCMDSTAGREAMMLDAFGYPYWLMPGAPRRQVEEAVGGLCRVFARGREGIGRNDCACALETLHAELTSAEFAVLAQALEAQPEGDVVVSVPADLAARLEALVSDPHGHVPEGSDGASASFPAGFAFTSGVADQWRRMVGDMVALDDEAPARLISTFDSALEACVSA